MVEKSPWRQFFENATSTVVEYISLYPELAHLAPKINGRATILFDRATTKCQVPLDGFDGLCHGDMWSNNIMFRRNHAVDARLLDFQNVFNGSPCFDLLRTLYGNSHEDLDFCDWDDLLRYYHNEYETTLKKLGFPEHRIPSLTMLHVQMLELCICEAFVVLILIGFRHLTDVENDLIAVYFTNDPAGRQVRLDSLTNSNCTRSVHRMLKYFDRIGVFD